ncbi:MAG TPA: hypothetical protein P5191_00155 [Ruminococcus sp.]|nr:hypothetical protein [Ruminococcus sp.]
MLNSDNANKAAGLEIDDKKVNRLIKKIIIAELKNINSEEKNDTQMATEIRKMIEEEVKCY